MFDILTDWPKNENFVLANIRCALPNIIIAHSLWNIHAEGSNKHTIQWKVVCKYRLYTEV